MPQRGARAPPRQDGRGQAQTLGSAVTVLWGPSAVALLSSRRRRDPLPSPRAGGPASSPPHRRFNAPPPTAPPACGAAASVGCQRRRILAACGHVGGATLCERTGSSSPGVCAPETAVCTTSALWQGAVSGCGSSAGAGAGVLHGSTVSSCCSLARSLPAPSLVLPLFNSPLA